jgi:hypothetical protein
MAGQIISRDLNTELLMRKESSQIKNARLSSWFVFVLAIGLVFLEYQLKLTRINDQYKNLDLVIA